MKTPAPAREPGPTSALTDPGRTERLAELAALTPGWLDGEGERISAAALQTAAEVIVPLTDTLGVPGVFPTPEGGVLLEWPTPRRVSTVDIGHDVGPDGAPVLICFDLVLGAGDSGDRIATVTSAAAAMAFFAS